MAVRTGLLVLLLSSLLCSAQQTAAPSAKENTPSPIKAFSLDAMDRSANPCDDFYQYACGGWISKSQIPPDMGSWGRFTELREHNREILHQILEKAASQTTGRSPVMQKIGDFYAACMDESKANALGVKPIEPELQRIAAIANPAQLMDEVARLHGLGVRAMFRFGQTPDYHDASMTIAGLDQGGLGLPNKDYYTKSDPKSVQTRERYQQHVAKMLQLLGDPAEKTAEEAKQVMDLENKLAAASLDPVAMRKPENRDHPMTRQAAAQMAPNLQLNKYFVDTGSPAFAKINVTNPEFFHAVNTLVEQVPLDTWKAYLRWHLAQTMAPYLSEPLVQEDFAFEGQYLGGAQQIQPRWKRCVALTDQQLGEALGQPYVDETFGAEGKQRTLKMVHAIEKAMGEDLQSLSWMTPETKKASAVKLAGVENKIGYPDHWRDYSKLSVTRDDLAGNVLNAHHFEYERNIDKIGKPTDKSEWGMSPPTVNAYYSPLQNNINFPAGILQPPFYSNQADDAVNFGGIGAVIGHELTHGFDDSGAKYDAEGNLRNWWTEADKKEFEQRTGCIADEYSNFVALPSDLHVNGRLTLGENTADNGGLRISYMALHDLYKQQGEEPGKIDGFTPEQRFFISYGQIWCEKKTEAAARRQALGDPHSPGRYRVNGVMQNMPEFQKAFGCHAGQKMVVENACRVW